MSVEVVHDLFGLACYLAHHDYHVNVEFSSFEKSILVGCPSKVSSDLEFTLKYFSDFYGFDFVKIRPFTLSDANTSVFKLIF